MCKGQQIIQVDGNDSDIDSSEFESSHSDDLDESVDVFDTDEVDNEPVQANLAPVPGQHLPPLHPVVLDIVNNDDHPALLPLCMMLNACSVFNKSDNLCELLTTICPSVTLISETFEREAADLIVF